MRRAIVLTTLGVLALISAGVADEPKLVKPKLIIADDGTDKLARFMHSARLSPDGKHLLYMRLNPVKVPAGDGLPARQWEYYRLILRDLKSGNDKPLPIPEMNGETAAAMLSGNVFGPGGKKIALGAGIDANNDGLLDHGMEKMQAVVYDIASGKLTKLPAKEWIVLATFDRTGKDLFIMSISRERKGKLLTTPLDNPKLKQLGKWGILRGVCPSADVVALAQMAKPGADHEVKLILYDLKADKQIAELPVHKKNTIVDDHCSQWTSDGRHLYYVDVKYELRAGRQERKYLTRIWDRTKGREAGIIGEVVPIGPGPGKSTMVVAKGRRGNKQMFLHDAATGDLHPLGKKTMTAIAAEGKYLLYLDNPPDGKSGIYMAEIVPAKKDKPAGKKEAEAVK